MIDSKIICAAIVAQVYVCGTTSTEQTSLEEYGKHINVDEADEDGKFNVLILDFESNRIRWGRTWKQVWIDEGRKLLNPKLTVKNKDGSQQIQLELSDKLPSRILRWTHASDPNYSLIFRFKKGSSVSLVDQVKAFYELAGEDYVSLVIDPLALAPIRNMPDLMEAIKTKLTQS